MYSELSTEEQPTIPAAYVKSPHEYQNQVGHRLPNRRPAKGQWRDGICDCFKNCWPSCWCSFFCCDGACMLAQIAQKSGFTKFSYIMVPYAIAVTITTIILIKTKENYCVALLFCMMILSVVIRLYIVDKYEIRSQSRFMECITGLCCFCCSTAQMARHLVGYRKVFDGDSDAMMHDYYDSDV